MDTERVLLAQLGAQQQAAAAAAMRTAIAAQLLAALVGGDAYRDPNRRGKLVDHSDVLAGLAVELADALIRRLQHGPSRV